MKKLKDLQELQKPRNPRNLDGPIIPVLCNSPKFPEELKPICQKPNAEEILERLETIAHILVTAGAQRWEDSCGPRGMLVRRPWGAAAAF